MYSEIYFKIILNELQFFNLVCFIIYTLSSPTDYSVLEFNQVPTIPIAYQGVNSHDWLIYKKKSPIKISLQESFKILDINCCFYYQRLSSLKLCNQLLNSLCYFFSLDWKILFNV